MTTTQPSYLSVTTTLTGDQWVITAIVAENSYLPPNIFVYENTGTTELGEYIGICNITELNRIQTWAGVAIPNFGNKFVRWSQAKIIVELATPNAQAVIQQAIDHMVKIAGQLNVALQSAANSTQVIQV